ncbi:kunitz-type serine protease inhibitor A-like isoform X3 [Dermacentor variabilis]|uniref:kunitz-type serine protease inhibitor A-like isoform X3 n=1 Tax=Dermacentor variabilis TaxID=34621 RepID=UPI003F5BB29B
MFLCRTIAFVALVASVYAPIWFKRKDSNNFTTNLPQWYGTVPVHCLIPAPTGPCRPLLNYYYYDPKNGVCKKVNPTLCSAGANLYSTKESCYEVCSTGRAQKETHCLRLPLIGTCEPVLQTWHHDRDKRICKRLNYTICSLGTKEFATEEMCLITCLPGIKPKVLCSLKPRSEPCMGRSRTWYFDLGSNSCHRFPSGRCAANDNGFTSRQKCLARCSYEK